MRSKKGNGKQDMNQTIVDLDDLEQQPLGILPFPAGLLLLESSSDFSQIASSISKGTTQIEFQGEFEFIAHAINQDLDKAYASIQGDSPIANYNRFVLSPTSQAYESLLQVENMALTALVQCVAYMVGLRDDLPDETNVLGSVGAVLFSTLASSEIDLCNYDRAISLLQRAILCVDNKTILRSLLQVDLAQALKLAGNEIGSVIACYEEALLELSKSEMTQQSAGALFELGLCYQEASRNQPEYLRRAVQSYHDALLRISRETSKELYGMCQINLALAYLAMPMVTASDTLRQAVAVSLLRGALEVFPKETHPIEWSNVTLNLANALVYSPSSHQGDNLVEAVEKYEELLLLRDRVRDPLGFARVVANQGNALAHLGDFEHAKAKLHESRMIFEEFSLYDEVAEIRNILNEIEKRYLEEENASDGAL